MKSLRDLRLLAVLVVAFFGLWLLVGNETAEEETDLRRSTFNHTYPGCKAAYLMLQELGVRTGRLTGAFPPRLEDVGSLVIADPVEPIGRQQAQTVLDWVRRGGQLLYIPGVPSLRPGGDSLGQLLGLQADAKPWHETPVSAAAAGPLARYVRRLYVGSGSHRFDKRKPGATDVFSDRHGVLLLAWIVGRGRIIALADGDPVSNEFINREGNARLVAWVAQREPVVFDEVHQGYASEPAEPSFWWQLGAPVRLAFYQLLFAALLMAWTASRRFGPPRLPPFEGRRTAGEYVVSLGRLMRRAGAEATALEILSRRFRHELAARVGAPADLSDDLLLGAVREHSDLPADRIEQALVASHGRPPPGLKPLDACALIASVREDLNLHGWDATPTRRLP